MYQSKLLMGCFYHILHEWEYKANSTYNCQTFTILVTTCRLTLLNKVLWHTREYLQSPTVDLPTTKCLLL